MKQMRKHVSEEEFTAYYLGDLSTEERNAIDAHRAQCEQCEEEFEMFYNALEEFPEQDWAMQKGAFLEVLYAQTIDNSPVKLLDQIRKQLHSISTTISQNVRFDLNSPLMAVSQAASLAEDESERDAQDKTGPVIIKEGETDNLRWRISEDEHRNLKIRIGSSELILEGHTLIVDLGEVKKDSLLRKIADNYIGAEIMVSSNLRQELSEDIKPEFKLG